MGPSKQLKQMIVKNPNWPEANQSAIYERDRGFELEATEKQSQVVVRAGLEPDTAGFAILLPKSIGKFSRKSGGKAISDITHSYVYESFYL